MLLAQTIRTAFHRPIIPVTFFFGGVTFDTFTLTRIDRLSDNLILLANLTLLGVLIVLMSRADIGSTTTETMPRPVLALVGARATVLSDGHPIPARQPVHRLRRILFSLRFVHTY